MDEKPKGVKYDSITYHQAPASDVLASGAARELMAMFRHLAAPARCDDCGQPAAIELVNPRFGVRRLCAVCAGNLLPHY